jgi:hypothetical protein
MRKTRTNKAVSGVALLLSAFASFGVARAGIVCVDAAFGVGPQVPSGYYFSSITTNSGCELGTAGRDEPRPDVVNADGMFGTNQWNVFQTFSDMAATSGTWNLGDDFYSRFGYAQIIFISEQSPNISPASYVGYLVTFANGTSGTWTSPFNDGQNLTNVGEMTIYWAGVRAPTPAPVSAVPLPAALPLLIGCLASFGVFGWCRHLRKHKS